VMIYDAATNKPTQARIRLSDRLIEASRSYEARNSSGKKNEENSADNKSADSAIPASFNPIVRLEWIAPERLYFQTAYIRVIPNDPISTFQRWHLLALSAQAALLR
ncbi:MAG: hypothetical protein M3539_10685, partial [Acidobacteriota bacterium]|nr:hypothetical protein [Acidobacteriota bacterium]